MVETCVSRERTMELLEEYVDLSSKLELCAGSANLAGHYQELQHDIEDVLRRPYQRPIFMDGSATKLADLGTEVLLGLMRDGSISGNVHLHYGESISWVFDTEVDLVTWRMAMGIITA